MESSSKLNFFICIQPHLWVPSMLSDAKVDNRVDFALSARKCKKWQFRLWRASCPLTVCLVVRSQTAVNSRILILSKLPKMLQVSGLQLGPNSNFQPSCWLNQNFWEVNVVTSNQPETRFESVSVIRWWSRLPPPGTRGPYLMRTCHVSESVLSQAMTFVWLTGDRLHLIDQVTV